MGETSNIPPELLAPVPRTIRRRQGQAPRPAAAFGRPLVGQFVSLMVTAVALVLLLFCVVEAIVLARSPLLNGTVMKVYYTGTPLHVQSVHVVYRFRDPSDGPHEAVQAVQDSYYLQPGDPVGVRWITLGSYHTSELNLILEHWFWERGPLSALGGIVLFVLVMVWRYFRKIRWLVRNGTPVMGRIVAAAHTTGRYRFYRVEAAYSVGGAGAEKYYVNGRARERMYEGDAVCVLYDPGNPKRSLIYDCSDYECVDGRSVARG